MKNIENIKFDKIKTYFTEPNSVTNANPQDSSNIPLYVDHKLLFNKLIWSIEDVALFTGLARGTIYNKTYKGLIPYRKRGNRLYFTPQNILNWIDEGDL